MCSDCYLSGGNAVPEDPYSGDFPFVSVVIPVLNDSVRLRTCLKAVLSQNWPRERFEIIIVDNGSKYPPVFFAAEHGAVLIEESIPGSYAARNKGILKAKGDIIAFTDADCVPEKNWIREGVSCITSRKNIGFVGGEIRIITKGEGSLFELYDQLNHFDQKRFVMRNKFAATANLFTKKSVIDIVGKFNPKFKSFGDVEWGKRVADHGYRAVYHKNCVVWHPAINNFKDLQYRSRRLAGGYIMMRRWQGYDRCSDIPLLFLHWFGFPFFMVKRFLDSRLKGVRQRTSFLLISSIVHLFKGVEELRLFFKPNTEER